MSRNEDFNFGSPMQFKGGVIPQWDGSTGSCYSKDLRKSKVLSKNDEDALSLRISKGDRKAVDELIKGNLRLVISIAKKFQGYGTPLEDLVGEGNLALCEIAPKFNHTLGRFSTFAYRAIENRILDFLEKYGTSVKFSTDKLSLKKNIERFENRYFVTNGYKPSDAEIIEAVGCSKEKLQECRSIRHKAISLDATDVERADEAVLNKVEGLMRDNGASADTVTVTDGMAKMLSVVKNLLSDKEYDIFLRHSGIINGNVESYDVIAMDYNVQGERVRRIYERTREKLQANAWRFAA
ncbi:MAG: sigma-70 family RNA polymerase sigma factor [Muribaculaceae bacterium]|nr:sigma-70 family RNA polymerase sigma factor [Muribaculaceae bacterium]